MRFTNIGIAAGLFMLSVLTLAQTPQEMFTQLPSCAATCFLQYAPQSGCVLTDIPCLCSDEDLGKNGTACAVRDCTTREALSAQSIIKKACGAPVRDRSPTLIIVNFTFLSLATVFVVIRVLAKSSQHFDLFWWDDVLIIVTYVTNLPTCILLIFLVRNGIGRDIWELSSDDINRVLFYFYLGEPFYLLPTVLMKISMLTFFLRLFIDSKLRVVVFAVMGLLACFLVVFLFTTIFQCTPIRHAWEGWQKEIEGRCIDVNAANLSNSALNIVFDLIVLAIPIPSLLGLQYPQSLKKVQIVVMFSVGIIVTIVSCLRLHSLVMIAGTTNPTWDFFAPVLWSAIEVDTGIICACLPATRVFTMRILPKWIGLSQRGASAEPVQRSNLHNRMRPPLSWTNSHLRSRVSGTGEPSADFIKLEDMPSSPGPR